MTMLLAVLALVGGLAVLIGGADALVRGAVALARRAGVSDFVVGVTVVAFGTSAPELFAAGGAALQGESDLAIGAVLGSNIANIGLIMGIGSLIMPMGMDRRVRRVEIPLMAAISLAAAALLLDQQVGRVEGAVLAIGLIAYVYAVFKGGHVDTHEIEEAAVHGKLTKALLFTVLGMLGLAIGARALVFGAVEVAEAVGVPSGIIGTTVVALGTSLPELAATARAALAKKANLAVGNIVGSNVFNLLSVLGVCALLRPLSMPDSMGWLVFAMLGFTAAILIYALSAKSIARWFGVMLLFAYLIYVGLAFTPGTGTSA